MVGAACRFWRIVPGRAQWGYTWDEAAACMRCSGLAQSRGTVPPIAQRGSRRSTTYQGQERSRCSSRDQLTGWLRAPRAVAGASSLPTSRGFPQARWRQVFPQPVAQSFLLPIDRGFPQAKRLKFSLRRMAQGFLLITQLGVSPSPHNLKFPLRRRPRVLFSARNSGFPSATYLEVFPAPVAQGSPLRVPLLPGWHQAFPETRGPRGCPIPGGPGFPPHRWLGVSSVPVAPDFSLPESPELSFAGWLGFPLRRLPSLVVGKFLRLSPGLHKRFRPAISRFFGRPQAIHS
jgi:hypothetical protein